MSNQKLFCTFYVDNHYFGIDAGKVQEILRHQPMSKVPLAPEVVTGLINIRGQIVTALDLRKRLQLPDHPKDKKPMNVVVRTDDGAVSLLVDEIGDVIEVDEVSFEDCPETLQGPARELILGAYKLETKLLMILDTDKVLDIGGDE